MKGLLQLFAILIIGNANAQAPSVVLDVNMSNIEPINVSEKNGKNNFWQGKYYYQGKGGTTSLKLCATNGTASGTTVIKEFNYSGNLYDFIAVKDFVYFLIDNTSNVAVSKKELWRTNGTEVGTILVKTFETTTAINSDVNLVSDEDTGENYSINENEIYFAGVSNVNGLELWKTNGTDASTVLVKDVYAGTNASAPAGFTRIGGTVYFAIGYYNVYPFTQLWKTDGTANGTVGIGQQTEIYKSQIVPFKGKLYFYGFDANGLEPWVSDGTAVGTTMLSNTSPNTAYYYSGPFKVLKSDNFVIFAQENYPSNSTNHLWKSDGTPSGTARMTPAAGLPISFAFSLKNYTIDNDFFYAYASGKILYKFNLSTNTNLSVLLPNSLEGMANWLQVFDSELWLTYRNSTNGIELWKTDFVTASMFADINPGSNASNPFRFFLNNNNFYFFANNSTGNKLFSLKKDIVFTGNISNNWNLAGNWDSNTIPTNADNVIIPTNKAVSISGSAVAKNITVYSPITLNTGELSLSGSLNLNSIITLNNNNLKLIGNKSSATGNTSSYIVTNGTGTISVENIDTARGMVEIPIGTTTNYNPIQISNLGTTDTFAARVESGVSQNYIAQTQGAASTSKAVNATWHINEETSGGSNVNLKLQWNGSQELLNFDRPTSKMGHYSGTSWEILTGTLAGTNPYTYNVTGVNSFSPFAIINNSFLNTADFNAIKLSIFPNPTASLVTISAKVTISKIDLLDIAGKQILSQNTNGVQTILDLSNLNSGIYFARILMENGSTQNQKIIKQ